MRGGPNQRAASPLSHHPIYGLSEHDRHEETAQWGVPREFRG
jgi:hypothetical protein